MAEYGINITETGKLDKMASDILLKQPPTGELATIGIKDKDWINTAFILPNGDGESFLEDIDVKNRYYNTAYLKWTDSSLGGNICINPLPQFTRYADIREPGLRVNAKDTTLQMQQGDLGMGNYYSEAIDDNMQVVHMRFGVPSYNSLMQFFTGFYNSSASTLARTGRFDDTLINGILKAGKEIVTFAVLPLAIVPMAIGLIGHAARYFMKWPASKFYYLKPTMPAYWTAVNNMMEQIGVNKGVSTFSPGYQQETIIGTTQKINTQQTSVLSTMFSDKMFTSDGRIDVYSIASRSKRMQMRQDYALRKQLSSKGDDGWFGRVKKVMNERGGGLNEARETESFSLETYLQRFLDVGILSGVSELFKGTTEKDIKAPEPPAEGSKGLENTPFAPSQSAASVPDYFLASAADGSEWVSFRVNNTGPAQESFSNATGKSSLAEKINSFSSTARDLHVNFAGGNIDSLGITQTIKAGIEGVLGTVASALHIDGLAVAAGAAFVDIPDHWTESTATLNKNTYSFTLVSPYGNIISQTVYLYLPLCCLLAGALPLATGKQSHTSPFLCEMYDRGRRTTRLGIIDSITISRGTTNLGFNNDDHPMAIDVTFSVTDLSSVVAMPILPGFSIIPGAGLFDPDSTYTDYLMTLSSMNLRDLHDRWPMLQYQAARAKADLKSYSSAARIAQDLVNLPGVNMLGAFMRGTERR